MTLKELITQEEARLKKEIGNEVALQICEEGEEVYFEDCCEADGDYDYFDLLNAEVEKYDYFEDYGEISGKLLLSVEVK